MGVVRIDDELLKKLKEMLKREENRYKYSSLASFVNSIVHDKLKNEVKVK
jgi:hypothetical protein